jgi:hypothetical protein
VVSGVIWGWGEGEGRVYGYSGVIELGIIISYKILISPQGMFVIVMDEKQAKIELNQSIFLNHQILHYTQGIHSKKVQLSSKLRFSESSHP